MTQIHVASVGSRGQSATQNNTTPTKAPLGSDGSYRRIIIWPRHRCSNVQVPNARHEVRATPAAAPHAGPAISSGELVAF